MPTALVLTLGLVVMGGAQPAGAPPAEGTLDTTFSGDGKVITSFGGNSDQANAVIVQPDGKIIAVGGASEPLWNFGLVRYNANGSLDTTFSADGKVTTNFGSGNDQALAVALQSNGKIVAAGDAFSAARFSFALVRYHADGRLDTTFGGDGKVITPLATGYSGVAGVAVQPDGKIVAAGYAESGASHVFVVVRYIADGTLDTSFSGDGKVFTSFGADAYGNDLALQSDGKIVVAGHALVGMNTVFAVVRYTRNGLLDTSFSGDGKQSTAIGPTAHANAVALQPDGKIVLGGYADNGDDDFAVARFNSNGSLDTAFGLGGQVVTPILAAAEEEGNSLALQRDGKIVLSGYADTGERSFALARFNQNGSLDATFAGDGTVATSLNTFSEARGVAIQRDGKIVLAGRAAPITSIYDVALARYVGDTVAPSNARMVALPRYATALARTVSWTATDTNTGVKSYDVRYRKAPRTETGYGGYVRWKSAITARSARFTGQAGRTYCFSVRARDWAGNVSGFGAESCMAFPVDERSLTSSGPWQNVDSNLYYGRTARRSSTHQAWLQLTDVNYRHLALVVSTGPDRGNLRVFLNNTWLTTVPLATAQVRHRVIIPIAASTTVKSGTVTIVVASSARLVVIEGVGISLA